MAGLALPAALAAVWVVAWVIGASAGAVAFAARARWLLLTAQARRRAMGPADAPAGFVAAHAHHLVEARRRTAATRWRRTDCRAAERVAYGSVAGRGAGSRDGTVIAGG